METLGNLMKNLLIFDISALPSKVHQIIFFFKLMRVIFTDFFISSDQDEASLTFVIRVVSRSI